MEKNENDNFAVRLMRAQTAAGLTAAGLARQISVHHSTIQQFYNGESEPKLGTLTKLAKALGVSTDYLCGMEEQS